MQIINLKEISKSNFKNIEEIHKIETFYSNIDKLIEKMPYAFIPNFFNDYFGNMSNKNLKKKYDIKNEQEISKIIKDNFKIKKKDQKSFSKNDKNNFDILMELIRKFSSEILTINNFELLRGIILEYHIKKSTEIKKNDFIEMINNESNFAVLRDEGIKKKFLEFIESDFENKIEKIYKILVKMKVIKKILVNNYNVNFNEDLFKKKILEKITYEKYGLTYNQLFNDIHQKFPILKYLTSENNIENYLQDIENADEIKIIGKDPYGNFSAENGVHLITTENYSLLMSQEESLEKELEQKKFYGRKITPERFIEEIIQLDRGDFGDKDDQITRICGLALAESVKLHAPHENIPMYDFATNTSGYRFSQEQIDAMQKINFKIFSDVIHFKIMINEEITIDILEKLKNFLPKTHQGVIISFKSISQEVKEWFAHNQIIQLVNQEGIKIWVEITSKIPCRVNSIAKIRVDPMNNLSGQICLINSINYETGLSGITLLPSLKESNVYIKHLEEIQLYEKSLIEFEILSQNYLEFLKLISKISKKDEFDKGIFDSENLESSEWSGTKIRNNNNNPFYCQCNEYLENNTLLCRHLINFLDKKIRRSDELGKTFHEYSHTHTLILKFIKNGIFEHLDLLVDNHDEIRDTLKIYLKKQLEIN